MSWLDRFLAWLDEHEATPEETAEAVLEAERGNWA